MSHIDNPTAAGGAGTVTSVSGGIGITNTPDPIVGVGVVNLDINKLTLESSLAPGDLFPFLDVSVGVAPADQRKTRLVDILAGLEAIGIDAETLDGLDSTAFQPLDGDLTALALLATTGYIVRTGAGTEATRTFQEGANIDLVNADGVAGNTTIAVAPQGTGSGLDADLLDGLDSTAFQPIDADLTAIAALAGTGILSRTAANTWALTSGTAGRVMFWATGGLVPDDDAALFWDDTNKRLAVGALQSTSITVNGSVFPALLALHEDGILDQNALFAAYHDSANGANVFFARSRGAPGAQTVVVDDNFLGLLTFVGYDGTDFERAARLYVAVDEPTPGPTAMGGAMVFETTDVGTIILAERARFSSDAMFDILVPIVGNNPLHLRGARSATTVRPINVNAHATTIDGVRPMITVTGQALSFNNVASVYIGMEVGSSGAASATWTIDANLVSAVGAGGRIFLFNPVVKNTASVARSDMGIWAALEFAPTFRADGAACTVPFILPFRDSTLSSILNAGTLAITEHTTVYSAPSYGAGVTTDFRRGLRYRNRASTGTMLNSIAVDSEDQTVSTLAAVVRSAMVAGTGKWFLQATGTAVSAILGGVRFGSGSAVPDGSSVVHIDGGYTQKRTAATDADYTALVTDLVIEFPAITAARTVNLPAVATAGAGKVYYVIKTTGGFTLTINPSGAELVNGGATYVLAAGNTYDTIRLYCTGAAWIASTMV